MPEIPSNPLMRTVRHRPTPPVQVGSGQLPLVDPKDPDSKQIQEHWYAKVRVFDLSKEPDLLEYEQIWQHQCDGTANICEHRVDLDAANGRYLAFVRWANIVLKAPSL